MKILVAADMEGISGVVDWDHVNPDHKEYARFRKLMTEEVNGAVRGAFDGGAEVVWVADGHAHGRNILIEELDPRAELQCGSPSPLAMVTGVESGVDGVMFVGYHARAGTERAILDHTWSGKRVVNLRLNGDLIGETGLNAALCGHFGTPVIMVTGDRAVCEEAGALLDGVETVEVKRATGRSSARCLAPEVAQKKVYERARRAVGRLRAGEGPEPFRLATPVELTIEFPQSEMVDAAALLPGTEREGRRLSYLAEDVVTAFGAMRSALALAA